MPELYGQPFKWELREELDQLKRAHWKECKEHRETRQGLQYAQCKIAELEAKIQRIEQKAQDLAAAAQGIIAEAELDVTEKTGERFIESLKKRWA